MRKQSFLERLTGTQSVTEDDLSRQAEEVEHEEWQDDSHDQREVEEEFNDDEQEESSDEPGLAIDIYESDNELVIQSMIAGVTPENLHISITRDTVTIRGKRNAPHGIPDEHYITRELYWGTFSREIELPYEIDTDGAEAVEKYGLLIIRLPKLDTDRTQELKVKSI